MAKHMIHSLGGSKSFGRLSLKAKVLWPMLIARCDDQGRFDADAQAIKWHVCQNVDEIAMEDVADLLGEMMTQGMLIVYGNDGEEYGQVVQWWLHQPMAYARESKYPPPDGWVDRVRYKVSKEVDPTGWIKRHWNEPGGFANGIPNVYLYDKHTIGTKEKKRNDMKVHEKNPSSPNGEVPPVKKRKNPDTPHHRVVAGYVERISKGYAKRYPGEFAGDMKAIKQMLGRGHPENTILDYYDDQKAGWWSTQHLSMRTIDKNIDDWVKAGGKRGTHQQVDDDPDGFNAAAARRAAERDAAWDAENA